MIVFVILFALLGFAPLVNAQFSERGDIRDVTWSPDGDLLAVLADHGVWLYDASAWDTPPLSIPLDEAVVRNLVFSTDGRLLAVGAEPNVHVWETTTLDEVLTIQDFGGHVLFTPNNDSLFAVRNSVEKFDLETGDHVSHFGGDYWSMWGLTISPDGRWLVEGNPEEGGHVWDLDTETLVTDIHANFTDLDFSPDSTRVAVGGFDGNIGLWNVSTQEMTTIDTGLTERITDVAFSPDGLLLASTYQDGTLLLANPATGDVLETVQAHHPPEDNVIDDNGLAFSPDGMLLATGSDDGVVHIWQLDKHLDSPLATLDGFTPTDQL